MTRLKERKPLVIHTSLMKLIKQPGDDRPAQELREGQTDYYNWHPVQAPTIYKDTTVIEFADKLRRSEESFEGNRIFGWARTYPLGANHESQIHTVEFKVELICETVQSVFWHIVSYARNESWIKNGAPPLIAFYDVEDPDEPIWCRYEVKHVPRSETEVSDRWGLIHRVEGKPAHTVMGSLLPDSEQEG